MKRHHYAYTARAPQPVGNRFAVPAAFLGSLVVIALLLYAIDTAPMLRDFLTAS